MKGLRQFFRDMMQTQKPLNITEQIETYITKFKDDEGGPWEYQHTPYLKSALNGLNEKESNEFSNKIWTWSEFNLYQIADPILFCENKYLDQDFLYLKIFSKINEPEYLDYLVENVVYYIPEMSKNVTANWDIDFMQSLKKNVLKTIEIKDSWRTSLTKVVDFLEKEIVERNISCLL